ncbi:MAG: RidA family protein [Albidovulum sp.]|nr:RidA family protein [Albidovulum sp.]
MPLSRVEIEESPSAWPAYPAAVRGGGFVFVSGVRGAKPDGSATPVEDLPTKFTEHLQGYSLVDSMEGEATAEAWTAHDNMGKALAASGSRQDQILRQRMWQRDKRLFPVLERVRKLWQPEAAPSSGLGVRSVGGRNGNWYGIECIAVDLEDPNRLGSRQVLTPAEHAANPSASIYSQMVASGPLVFLAGHIPIRTAEPGKPVVGSYDDVPKEGRFLATGRSHPDARDGPIAAQTWFVYNEIRRALEGDGMRMEDIVHVRIYLSDLRDLAAFHRVHRHFFETDPPALCIVGFDEVGHKGCRIEIEPTALKRGSLRRESFEWRCPAPFAGPAALRAGPLLFLAGMPGIDATGRIAMDSGSVAPEHAGKIASLEKTCSSPCVPSQIWWAWRRIYEACESACVEVSQIAKTVVYLRDESDLIAYEPIRTLIAPDSAPAFDCVVVANPGPVDEAAVQIDATVLIDS